MSRNIPPLVKAVVNAHSSRIATEAINVLGYEFNVWPKVFSPRRAPSGLLTLGAAATLSFKGMRVLEVGCGAGVFSCFAAIGGAKSVVGTDISSDAIGNSQENAVRHGVGSVCRFIQCDLFNGLEDNERFDIIYADLPFVDASPTGDLEKAFYDKNLVAIKQFLKQVDNRLSVPTTSVAYIAFSDMENLSIHSQARQHGLQALQSVQVQFENRAKIVLFKVFKP